MFSSFFFLDEPRQSVNMNQKLQSTKRTPSFLLKGGYAMELRFEKARATRDIDLTYLERFKTIPQQEISGEIFQELRDISQINMEDFFVYQIGEAQLGLENAP